jgi:hypothetical protein
LRDLGQPGYKASPCLKTKRGGKERRGEEKRREGREESRNLFSYFHYFLNLTADIVGLHVHNSCESLRKHKSHLGRSITFNPILSHTSKCDLHMGMS